jgi:hypothetical protein
MSHSMSSSELNICSGLCGALQLLFAYLPGLDTWTSFLVLSAGCLDFSFFAVRSCFCYDDGMWAMVVGKWYLTCGVMFIY